jgi:hypothetical protein
VIRCSVEGAVSGVNWANIFWVRNGNAQTPGQSDLNAFVDALVNEYQSAFLGHIHTGVTVSEGVAVYYGPTGGDLGSNRGFSMTGSGGGAGLPNNVAQCVGWQLQQRYRGGHPRTYFPAPGNVAQSDSRLWLPSQVSAMTSAANSFHAFINGQTHGALSDLHLGTVSFVLRNAWRTPPLFRDFTLGGAHMDLRIDSMRRRLGRDIV